MPTIAHILFQGLRSHLGHWGKRMLMGALACTLMACTNPMLANRGPLYIELGGIEGIKAVIGRTLDRVSQDPRSRRSFEGIKMAPLKASVSDYVCQIADGPCNYEGETMQRSHADLKITGSEFDLMVEILREELNGAGVSTAAKNDLLKRLAPTRRDIVKP